jgi:PAS domain S-box-containing protein
MQGVAPSPEEFKRKWLDVFIDASHDAVMAFDRKLVIRFINESAYDLFGKKGEALEGAHIEKCGPVGSIIAPTLFDVLKMKEGMSCEYEIPFGAQTRHFQASYSLVQGDTAEILGVVGVLREITDRRNRLRNLAASNKRLETHARTLEVFDVVSESDLTGKILYANENFCALSKYERSELIGKNYRILNSGFHSKSFFRNLWNTISLGRVWFGEIKNRAKDGSFYWAQTIIAPMLNEEGKLTGFLSIQRDFTAEKDQSMLMQDLTVRLRQLLDFSPCAIVNLDLDGQIVFCNRPFFESTGLSEREVVGKNWFSEFIDLDQRTGIQQEILAVLADRKKLTSFEAGILGRDGKTRVYNWRASGIRDSDGSAIGVQLTGDDISDVPWKASQEKQSEENLLQKKDVIGFVSHELKGGLVSIQSGLFSVQEALENSEIKRDNIASTVKKIINRVDRLEQLSQDLLENITKNGQPVRVKLQSASLRALILDIWSRSIKDIPESRKMKFSLNIPEEDIIVQWDPIKIGHVLSKLIAKSIQFSKPEGAQVTLTASKINHQICVSVAGEGEGVPPRDMDKIFDLFLQKSDVGPEEAQSFKMGLKLSKDIVHKHHGRIWIETKAGVGNIFYFLIPIDPKVSRSD